MGSRELTSDELKTVVAGASKEVSRMANEERKKLDAIANMNDDEFDNHIANDSEVKEVSNSIKNVMDSMHVSDEDSELARMINDVGEKYDLNNEHVR